MGRRGGVRRAGGGAVTPPRTGHWRPCDKCGADFYVRPSGVKKAIKRGSSPPRFCSRACQHEAYRGSGNPKWRGGRTISVNGYVYLWAPDHPHCNKDGYVAEHRLVMEKHLGRYLEPTECVHHFNHNRQDNRIENLELMESWRQHQRHHGYYEPRECGNCGTIVMRSRAARRRYPKQSFCSRKCAAASASRAAAIANRKQPA